MAFVMAVMSAECGDLLFIFLCLLAWSEALAVPP